MTTATATDVAVELPVAIKSMARLRLAPGDVLVLHTDGNLAEQDLNHLLGIKEKLPEGVEVFILEGGITWQIDRA